LELWLKFVLKLHGHYFYLDDINSDVSGLQFRQPETVVMYQPAKYINQVQNVFIFIKINKLLLIQFTFFVIDQNLFLYLMFLL